MKVILSSNPYRDRGLKSAQEAKRVLERENIETVMCLPFTPRKGEKVEIPQGVVVSTLEKELPTADLLGQQEWQLWQQYLLRQRKHREYLRRHCP